MPSQGSTLVEEMSRGVVRDEDDVLSGGRASRRLKRACEGEREQEKRRGKHEEGRKRARKQKPRCRSRGNAATKTRDSTKLERQPPFSSKSGDKLGQKKGRRRREWRETGDEKMIKGGKYTDRTGMV